jgi:ADP-ribose pyrophosphatase YjhB (NUDIX family)
MIGDPDIGVVTGKGFFRKWGPNYTADSVIMQAGHVLLIKRGDSDLLAVTGGFRDFDDKTGALEDPLHAAIREPREESGADLSECRTPVQVYQGPVADIRMTANAWPETTAYLFDLGDDPNLPPVSGRDDAKEAYWRPIEEARRIQLHGSHNLLIELAWHRLCRNRA